LRPKESKRNQNCNVVCILYRLQAIPLGEEMLHGAASNWMQIQNFPKIVCVAKIVALASGPDSMQDSITEGLRSSSGVVTSRHRLASQPTNAQHSVLGSTLPWGGHRRGSGWRLPRDSASRLGAGWPPVNSVRGQKIT
jgi:hypothetical protein